MTSTAVGLGCVVFLGPWCPLVKSMGKVPPRAAGLSEPSARRFKLQDTCLEPAVPWGACWVFESFAWKEEVESGVSRFPDSAVFLPVGAAPWFAEHSTPTMWDCRSIFSGPSDAYAHRVSCTWLSCGITEQERLNVLKAPTATKINLADSDSIET